MKKVLVVGDVMLDKYVNVETVRISDEAPILIVKEKEEEYILGGAGNVAANLRALGVDVTLCGVIGNDEHGQRIISVVAKQGIKNALRVTDTVTTVKRRYVCKGKQLLRVDREDTSIKELEIVKNGFEVIVISDYNKGIITPALIEELKKEYPKAQVFVNGKPEHINLYKGVKLLTFNLKEINSTLQKLQLEGVTNPTPESICKNFRIKYLVATKGKDGIDVYTEKGLLYSVSSPEVDVSDVTGAGDTVIATLTYAIADRRMSIKSAIELAEKAGSLKVQKDKTAVVTAEELELNPEDSGREYMYDKVKKSLEK